MDEFIHWPKPFRLLSATCDEILSWMIGIWMKHHSVSVSNCDTVDLYGWMNIQWESFDACEAITTSTYINWRLAMFLLEVNEVGVNESPSMARGRHPTSWARPLPLHQPRLKRDYVVRTRLPCLYGLCFSCGTLLSNLGPLMLILKPNHLIKKHTCYDIVGNVCILSDCAKRWASCHGLHHAPQSTKPSEIICTYSN